LAGHGSGYNDGVGTAASFFGPVSIAVDSASNVYVVDGFNALVRRISTSRVVTTVAGGGGCFPYGFQDGVGTASRFYYPYGIAMDTSHNLIIADSQNHAIRMITPTGIVTTIASGYGSQDGVLSTARFANPIAVVVRATGEIVISDQWNNMLRSISTSGACPTLVLAVATTIEL
jgi:hypothetical protein